MPCVMLVMKSEELEGSRFACSSKLNLHVAQYTTFHDGPFSVLL